MPLSERIRSALSMSRWQSSSSSSSFSDAYDSTTNSPHMPQVLASDRTPTSTSTSSTTSIIAVPALRLKKTFSDLRGARQRRKEERYHEAVAQWAEADEREWQCPTWGGPAKKSRKFSREQRDSLRSWGWDQQSPSGFSFESHSPRSSVYSEISPCTSRNDSFFHSSSPPLEPMFSPAGRNGSGFKLSSRAERARTVYGNT